ncbi:unnamed protein product [Larinioides sclopetarius]|uniref:Uncharacterized protein n=1 Tax=Larinioides sclopetarius TaxID=280406 RepID=A0AAV1ZWY1_9ARAC
MEDINGISTFCEGLSAKMVRRNLRKTNRGNASSETMNSTFLK